MDVSAALALFKTISKKGFIKLFTMLIGNIKDVMKYDKIEKSPLYKDENMQVIILNLPKGEELKPHISPVDAFFAVQQGEAEFTLEGEVFLLKPGDLFHFKAKQVHAVKALSDFSMLIMK
jgi:quercetin dioxygenase-like cupin family protein